MPVLADDMRGELRYERVAGESTCFGAATSFLNVIAKLYRHLLNNRFLVYLHDLCIIHDTNKPSFIDRTHWQPA